MDMEIQTKSFEVGGVAISYKKSGRGRPIIFVHGNMGSNKDFEGMHGKLSGEYTVYAPDTRSHGQSGAVRQLSYDDIADDIVALVRHEQMEKPIFFGYSDGAIVGLLLGIKHPDMFGKLLIAGVNLKWNGVKAVWRFLARLIFCFSLSGRLRDKMRLMIRQPEITAEELRKIETPLTVFYGEKDIVKLSHSQTVIDNVAGSELVIVKGENHGSYILDNDKLYGVIRGYI